MPRISLTGDAPVSARDLVCLLLLADPFMSVAEITDCLDTASLHLTAFAIAELRHSFRHTLKVMRQSGYEVNKLDRRLVNNLIAQLSGDGRTVSTDMARIHTRTKTEHRRAVNNNRRGSTHRVDCIRSIGTRARRANVDHAHNLRAAPVEVVRDEHDRPYYEHRYGKRHRSLSVKSATKQQIIAMLNSGMQQSAIAKAVNVSRAYVCQIRRRYRQAGSVPIAKEPLAQK